jgi:hypothetical protein
MSRPFVPELSPPPFLAEIDGPSTHFNGRHPRQYPARVRFAKHDQLIEPHP